MAARKRASGANTHRARPRRASKARGRLIARRQRSARAYLFRAQRHRASLGARRMAARRGILSYKSRINGVAYAHLRDARRAARVRRRISWRHARVPIINSFVRINSSSIKHRCGVFLRRGSSAYFHLRAHHNGAWKASATRHRGRLFGGLIGRKRTKRGARPL